MRRLEIVDEKHHTRYNQMMEEWKDSGIDSAPKILRTQDSYVPFNDIYRVIDQRMQKVKSEVFFLLENERLLWILQLRFDIQGTIYEQRWWNIAYGIRPTERQKWYATEILRLGLEEMKHRDYKKVLLTCTADNIASQKVILKNGGIFEKQMQDDNGEYFHRYFITL
jgi:predicted acetyltransferase